MQYTGQCSAGVQWAVYSMVLSVLGSLCGFLACFLLPSIALPAPPFFARLAALAFRAWLSCSLVFLAFLAGTPRFLSMIALIAFPLFRCVAHGSRFHSLCCSRLSLPLFESLALLYLTALLVRLLACLLRFLCFTVHCLRIRLIPVAGSLRTTWNRCGCALGSTK